jgi:uncharacterized membrane protein YphA (DoxX/SURF4 family)
VTGFRFAAHSHSIISTMQRLRRGGGYDTVYLRVALAVGFLAAVTDRFGLWGPYGATNVAWGDFGHFLAYTALINPELPAAAIPIVGWTATVAEVVIALALLVGFRTREAAMAAAILLFLFALAMTIGTGIKSPLNASVFAASAGALVLARMSPYPLSLDALLARANRHSSEQL